MHASAEVRCPVMVFCEGQLKLQVLCSANDCAAVYNGQVKRPVFPVPCYNT